MDKHTPSQWTVRDGQVLGRPICTLSVGTFILVDIAHYQTISTTALRATTDGAVIVGRACVPLSSPGSHMDGASDSVPKAHSCEQQ
jgi:hypothetical protein